MTFPRTLFVLLVTASQIAFGADGASLLFSGAKGNLSQADKRAIFSALGYKVSPDGKELVAEECGAVSFETSITDLNLDDIPEVVVFSGNTCTSGYTGSSVHLFVKDTKGKYQPNLGFPAADYVKLKGANRGFPDLLFGGPGFCHGVWRWNGTKYAHRCNHEDEPGACTRKDVTNVCPHDG